MVLGQGMPWLRSASFAFVMPGGCQYEPQGKYGVAGLACEMVQRGAGPYTSRQVVSLSDNLGLDRTASVSTPHTLFGAAMPAESLMPAIELYTQIIREPHFPADQLEDARNSALQELRANEDEPVQRVMMRLKELHYGTPLGHSPLGDLTGIENLSLDDIREFYHGHYQPTESILSVAGRFDWDATIALLEDLLSGWQARPIAAAPAAQGRAGYEHIHHPSQQTHIGFSFPAFSYEHPDFFTQRAALGILSDGMSSRLFDRVREQRGLCYTISASTHSLKGMGGIFGYAGTTPERAQETLDVTLAEIRNLGDSVEKDELERFKVRIQSSLVMQQESSSARASSLATDWYFLKKTLSPEEIEARVDAVTPEMIGELWTRLPLDEMRFVTLGPSPLQVPSTHE
jgi:predicted Zn-dependent peptidase